MAALAQLAAAYCLAAGCTASPLVQIEYDPRNMPKGIVAHVTVSHGVCTLTFLPKAARKPEVIAHEACHCALDASVLSPYGYQDVTPEDVERREERADACAQRLLEGRD